MSHLTVVGGSSPKKPFSMNAHGIAQFILASRYGARRIIESFAFPNEERPRITMPSPAKELVYHYYRGARDESALDQAIIACSYSPIGETKYEKGRRESMLRAAQHLKRFGPTCAFEDVRKRPYNMMIEGLRVRASVDFIASIESKGRKQTVGVIFNVTTDISDHADRLTTHARVESEIAYRGLTPQFPNAEVWYIDLPSEKIIRKQTKKYPTIWREIEAACNDVVISYNSIVARPHQIESRAT